MLADWHQACWFSPIISESGRDIISSASIGNRWRLLFPLCLLIGSISGCGGGTADIAKVKGVVTRNGSPLPDAWIEFLPDFDARPAVGRTDKDGQFEMTYTARETGARIGKYKVQIGTGGKLDPADPSGRTDIPKVMIYERTDVEVEPGPNELDFDVPAGK